MWLNHRNNIITIAVISALLLIGAGSAIGLNVTSPILGTSFTWLHLIAIGQAYVAFALWKRYV